MLLRLLPTPTPSQPSPPTILFTLPLPAHPYTSRSLPLPPNLLAHRSVCLQEDIECPNVLLGEKASWISGIIDDVTFSLPANEVAIHLIDGTTVTCPLSQACLSQLHRVIAEVQASFAPPPPPPEASPRSSTSSVSSVASTSSATAQQPPPQRRTPSSLLLSLLSPLLPVTTNNSPISPVSAYPSPLAARATAAQPPARMHRRLARSLLVDTYRQHVLPFLHERLPSAYLPWVIESETTKKLGEFETLRSEITTLLSACNIDRSVIESAGEPLKRNRSCSGSSSSGSETDSEWEGDHLPTTPGTSIFTASACSTPVKPFKSLSTVNPQNFLLSIPPAHALPQHHRATYSAQLARLTAIASRLQAIKKLNGRYEREEGKRRWLEGLERGRMAEKALRRAASNGLCPVRTMEVTKHSRLWKSWTADDVERQSREAEKAVHPAMMMMEDEAIQSSDESSSEEDGPITPVRPSRLNFTATPTTPLCDLDLPSFGTKIHVRPALDQRSESFSSTSSSSSSLAADASDSDDLPALIQSMSDESLAESVEWEGGLVKHLELLPGHEVGQKPKTWELGMEGAMWGNGEQRRRVEGGVHVVCA